MGAHKNYLQTLAYGLLLTNVAIWEGLVPTQARAEERTRCTCPSGATMEIGAVRYDGNSDRQTITRIKVEDIDSERRCAAIWMSHTEIYPTGTPYSFYLKRRRWKEQREDGCGDTPQLFFKRKKNYQFVFDADSRSIREMQPFPPEAATQTMAEKASSQSNANLWDAIAMEYPVEPLRKANHPLRNASAPEFGRSAWVFARKEMTGSYVGLVHGLDQDKIVTLRKTHKIKAGQLGQIEAFHGRNALVRFYDGSRIEKFTKSRNALRLWYDNIGGPYAETKDDLYTPLKACILEVSLDDLVEINDYLDQQKTDRT